LKAGESSGRGNGICLLRNSSGVLMQTSEDVNTILQVQLDASRKLYNIMKDVSTLSEPSKAYLHTAENLAEILNSVRLLPDASRELTSISAGMKELRLHAEGMDIGFI
jgi:hypothetical protein